MRTLESQYVTESVVVPAVRLAKRHYTSRSAHSSTAAYLHFVDRLPVGRARISICANIRLQRRRPEQPWPMDIAAIRDSPT